MQVDKLSDFSEGLAIITKGTASEIAFESSSYIDETTKLTSATFKSDPGFETIEYFNTNELL